MKLGDRVRVPVLSMLTQSARKQLKSTGSGVEATEADGDGTSRPGMNVDASGLSLLDASPFFAFLRC